MALGVVTYFAQRELGPLASWLLVSGTGCLALFALTRPDELRNLVGGRRVRYGTSTLLSILFLVAISILIYWLAYQNPHWRIDTTEFNELTPLPETSSLLKQVDEPIHVIGFYTLRSATMQELARAALQSMRAVNPRLTFEFVDPNANPLLAEEYGLTGDGTLVFTRGEGVDRAVSRTTSTSDRELYAALLQVVNPREKKVYHLTGHGERGIDDFGPEGVSNMADDLAGLGFAVESLNLALTGTVPDDADVLVLIDQRIRFQAAEVEAISDYLSAGGAAMLARDVVTDDARQRVEADGLADLLEGRWGVNLRNDLIVEPELGLAGQVVPIQFVALDFGPTPVADAELRNLGVLFDIARSVAYDPASRASRSYIELVRTSESAWGETNFTDQPILDDADTAGPLTIGVTLEDIETGTRLVVIGDTDFVSNELVYLGGNGLLYTNAINWLARDEVALALAPRETVERRVAITERQLLPLQAVSCLLGPAIVAGLGLMTWYSRSRRR
jgi:ABC-type uncharacterized transport system involved in gliding motility auxiliary subunit